MQLDLRKCHGNDYLRAGEPAAGRARPSSMDTPKVRRAGQPSGATRPGRASGSNRGRGMPSRITAVSWAVLLTGTGLFIAACGAASSSGSASVSSGSGAEPAPAAGAANGNTAHRAALSARAPAKEAFSGALGSKTTVTGAKLAPISQSIIMTANLTVRVTNAGRQAAAAMSYVTGAGGYTAGEQAQLSPSPQQRQSVSMTLKVPQADYGTALNHLSGLGKPLSLQQQSVDVTQQVADVASRVTSEQDAIVQLRGLLKRTANVTGLLEVQQQISSDESSLEALQAQQRALDRETSYATISLLLLGPKPHAATDHHHHAREGGFLGGLKSGWHGLGHATTWVLTVLGAVLPFLVALVILGAVGYLLWRRFGRRRAAPAATPASET